MPLRLVYISLASALQRPTRPTSHFVFKSAAAKTIALTVDQHLRALAKELGAAEVQLTPCKCRGNTLNACGFVSSHVQGTGAGDDAEEALSPTADEARYDGASLSCLISTVPRV
jgi:hypothetical protein